jgi:hypothetical protein
MITVAQERLSKRRKEEETCRLLLYFLSLKFMTLMILSLQGVSQDFPFVLVYVHIHINKYIYTAYKRTPQTLAICRPIGSEIVYKWALRPGAEERFVNLT